MSKFVKKALIHIDGSFGHTRDGSKQQIGAAFIIQSEGWKITRSFAREGKCSMVAEFAAFEAALAQLAYAGVYDRQVTVNTDSTVLISHYYEQHKAYNRPDLNDIMTFSKAIIKKFRWDIVFVHTAGHPGAAAIEEAERVVFHKVVDRLSRQSRLHETEVNRVGNIRV